MIMITQKMNNESKRTLQSDRNLKERNQKWKIGKNGLKKNTMN